MTLFLNVDKTQLSIKHRRVMEVIEKKGFKVAYMSIEDLAGEAEVSLATVSRFWKLAGFKNFKDFKEYVKQRLETTPENKLKNSVLDVGDDNLFDRVIQQNYEFLFQTHAHLDQEALNKSAAEILQANRIFIYAPSSSEGLGSLLRHRLKRYGIPVEKIAKSGHEIYESIIHFAEGDVVIIFQYVKSLPESEIILDYTTELGVKTILFTDQLVANMNKLANYVLYAHRGDSWAFHSMIAPTTIVEALVLLISQQLEDHSLKNLENLSHLRRKYGDIVPN